MHSSDEETAGQTKGLTADSTTVYSFWGGKNSWTLDVFKKVSLEIYLYICQQEQVCLFMTV